MQYFLNLDSTYNKNKEVNLIQLFQMNIYQTNTYKKGLDDKISKMSHWQQRSREFLHPHFCILLNISR